MVMKNYIFKQRATWCVFFSLMYLCCYQFYQNYYIDKYITDAMALHNESTVKSAAKVQDLFGENIGLKHNLMHLQAENHALVGQIEHIIGYYSGEMIKLGDENMILKSGPEKNK
tara:strand:+ start:3356 stop:3697 length:342 start_codon:yes stop_codon:yes gene_type:complete